MILRRIIAAPFAVLGIAFYLAGGGVGALLWAASERLGRRP